MASTRCANYEYASITDVGNVRLANEDALHNDERMGLFVVSDGIGGHPSGEAASQLVANTLGLLFVRRLKAMQQINGDVIERSLILAANELSAGLVNMSNSVAALRSMGATLVAALVDLTTAYIVHAGDSRAYCLRDGVLLPLTEDHTQTAAELAKQAELPPGLTDDPDRRLLMEFMGKPISMPLAVTVNRFALQPSDRLLLCTDGVTDPVEASAIQDILLHAPMPNDACNQIVRAAKNNGAPDNVTATVIDYLGLTQRQPIPKPAEPTGRPPKGVTGKLYIQLGEVEEELAWLHQHAKTTAAQATGNGQSQADAMEQVKALLGPEVYEKYLELQPSSNPSHVFHRACSMPESPWRQRYQAKLDTVEPTLDKLFTHQIKLNPLLTGEQTSYMLRQLWMGWRQVERRYFACCTRDASHESEQTLTILINHMHQSVRTMRGLIEGLPRFLR